MKTTSFTIRRHFIVTLFTAAIFIIILVSSCRKEDREDYPNKPSSYTAEVLDKWMTLQLRLMRNATGIPNQAFARHFAYAGVVALEALKPGLPGHAGWPDKWNGLTGLPLAKHGKSYYYPANVNAAMAAINKAMFSTAGSNDIAAIDSLEAALNQVFLAKQSVQVINTSSDFGRAVANAVFNWAETDGYKNANKPYTHLLGRVCGCQHHRHSPVLPRLTGVLTEQ